MRSGFISITALLLVSVLSPFAYADPVTLPSGAKNLKGTIHEGGEAWATAKLGIAVESNFIDEIELSDYQGKIEGNINTIKVIYSVAERVDLYTDFGVASGLDYTAMIGGSNVTFNRSDEFAWGAGVAILLYEDPSGLAINTDLKYRAVQTGDYDSVVVDGTSYTRSQLTAEKDADFEQWQLALGLSYKFSSLTPYAGIKFVGGDYSASATAGGATYNLGSTDMDSRAGAFAGVSIIPTDRLAIDLQGRFADEDAVSASLTFMF